MLACPIGARTPYVLPLLVWRIFLGERHALG